MTTKSFINWELSNQLNLDFSNVTRYIEVVVGNQGHFACVPQNIPCLLNDPNSELIEYYKSLTDVAFISELNAFAKAWKLLEDFSLNAVNEHFMSFLDYSDGVITKNDLTYMVRAIVLMHLDNPKFDLFIRNEFVVSFDMFTNSIVKNIVQELVRLKTKVDYENFTPAVSDEFIRSIETAYRSGVYVHFQNLYNWKNTDLINCVSRQKLIAIWYFLNQLAQGQSVQYDKNGNIKSPYGGEIFNFYDFETELEVIKSEPVQNRLRHCQFFNLNPEQFMASMPMFENDLVVFHLTENGSVNSRNMQGNAHGILNLFDSIPSKWAIFTPSESVQSVSALLKIPQLESKYQSHQISVLKNF